MFFQRGVLKKFAIFTEKHLFSSILQACNFIRKRLQRRCFPVSITNIFLQNTSDGCFCFHLKIFFVSGFLFKLLIKLTFFNRIFPIITFFSQFHFIFIFLTRDISLTTDIKIRLRYVISL